MAQQQLTEACGWEWMPEYLVRDRDSVYGEIFTRRIRAMGIRDRPIAPRSRWQNGYAERLIGSVRRESLDHVVVFGERHLRVPRAIQAIGRIHANPISAVYIINMFGFDFRQGQPN
jgi:hypothetical protein